MATGKAARQRRQEQLRKQIAEVHEDLRGEIDREAQRERINQQIGNRLKQWREVRTMSQAEVARALKMSRGRWSMYEAGKRTLSVHVMIEFCELAKADPAFILMGNAPKQSRVLSEKQRKMQRALEEGENGHEASG